MTLLVSKTIEFGEKKRKIRATTPLKVIQGHRGRYQSKARVRLPISDILSHTVSKLSQLIVQILDTLGFSAPFGGPCVLPDVPAHVTDCHLSASDTLTAANDRSTYYDPWFTKRSEGEKDVSSYRGIGL